MKLSWTFFPKHGQSVTLNVEYMPALDREVLPQGGYLNPETNTAYVNWDTFRRFNEWDVKGRKDAFQRLIRIGQPGSEHLPQLMADFHRPLTEADYMWPNLSRTLGIDPDLLGIPPQVNDPDIT